MRRRPSMFLYAEPWHVRLISGVFVIFIIMVGINIVKLQRLHRAYAGEGPVYGSHEEKLQRIWGSVYDRGGELVAGNYFEMRVTASRMALEQLGYDQFRNVAELLDIDSSEEAYRKRIDTDSRFVELKVYPYHDFDYGAISQKLRQWNLGSLLIFDPRSSRYYPEKRFDSGFLSYASPDRNFTCGIERTMDSYLSGQEGLRRYSTSRAVPLFNEQRAVDGDNVFLSIDSTIQFIVEKELKRTVHRMKAKGGYVVVTRPGTGEIVSLAGYAPGRRGVDSLVVAGAYEPGSTIKPLITAIALDRGLVDLSFSADCEQGNWQLGKRRIRDSHRYGVLSLPEIVWHSSNIGAVKLGMKLDKRTLYDGLARFGFGNRTGIQLGGETAGYFLRPEKWHPQTKISMSFGYGASVNVVQMTMALNAVINGGMWMPPRLVSRVTGPDGLPVAMPEMPEERRVISELTSSKMRDILRGVVSFGTGTEAAIPGYDIGGKTGTARKLKNGRYTSSYLSSFYGFFPVNNPQVSIYVMIDDPKPEYYGGKVAAPLFKDISRKIIPLMMDEIGEAEIDLVVAPPEMPAFPDAGPIRKGVVPDLKGLPFRDALIQAHQAGFNVECSGHGRVISQIPGPGVEVAPGAVVALRGYAR